MCQRLESEYIRVAWVSRSVVKVSMSELEWKRVCQSWSESEYVRVGVEVSMSELEWKRVCHSWSGREYVRVAVEASMSELEWK